MLFTSFFPALSLPAIVALIAGPVGQKSSVRKPAPVKAAIAAPKNPGALVFDFDDPKKTNGLSIGIDAPLEPVVGFASEVTGTARFDPEHPELTTGKLVVPVKSITFSSAGYTNSVRGYGLRQDDFPNITCVLKKIVDGKVVTPGVYEGRVEVDFTMRGVTKPLTIPLSVRFLPGMAKERDGKNEGDLLVVRTTFTVKRSQFGVAPEVPVQLASDDITIGVGLVGTYVKRAGSPVAPRQPDPGPINLEIDGKKVPIQERMAFHKIPGCTVGLVKDGKIAWLRHFGSANPMSKMPVNEKTLYPAGAMGWPVAATIALRLAQDGKIDLDRDINAYLKDWKAPKSGTTVRQMLQGKTGFTRDKYYGYDPDGPVPTLLQVLKGEKPSATPAATQVSEPGTTFNLSAENLAVLQKVLEDATGLSTPDLARKIFGDHDSAYLSFPPDKSYIRFARGTDEKGANLPAGSRAYPELMASGLWVRPEEWCGFLCDLMSARNGRDSLLDAQYAKMLLEPFLPVDGEKDGQTMGFGINAYGPTRFLYRGGNAEGYYCITTFLPEKGAAIVMFANRDLCWQFANEIRDSVGKAEGLL